MHIFYTPNIKSDAYFTLDEQESKHAIRVLRLKQDNTIMLVDGKGGFHEAVITEAHQKRCEVQISKVTYEEQHKVDVHIAIAPTKNISRLEFFVEKCTEMGISNITPIFCEHSERKKLNIDRLQKIAISAMKQSLKATLPSINAPQFFEEFIAQAKAPEKYIAHCHPGKQKHLQHAYQKKPVIILIGPEGDFSEDELVLATHNNYLPVSFGKQRLRTETAGIVACNIINLAHE